MAARLTVCTAPKPAENVCGDSWHLVGNSCLKFITANDSYDNAKLACRSHNAILASLTTQKKVDFVLKELHTVSRMVKKRRPGRRRGDRRLHPVFGASVCLAAQISR